MKKTKPIYRRLLAIAIVGQMLCMAPAAIAAPIYNTSGLSGPKNVVTFEEIVLVTDTPVTSQYAGLGVTFSSGLFYDGVGPNTGDAWPNMSGHAIANFDGNTCPCVTPFSINFVNPVSAAAFAIITEVGPTLFEAILMNGSPIESFIATVGLSSTKNYLGFEGIIFDQIRVTRLSSVSTVFDNIQFNRVPEPSAFAILGLGLVGLGVMRRRRTGGSL